MVKTYDLTIHLTLNDISAKHARYRVEQMILDSNIWHDIDTYHMEML